MFFWTRYSRSFASERRVLRRQGCLFRAAPGGIEDPGTVRKKAISEKCLGATKVPDTGRRRHQCLGLIGHNGAGKTTRLKMLNGLIKSDHGTIMMRGRVGALIALGAGFNPILTGREPEGWEARRTSNRRLARRVQRRREGANQNIFLNGAILGMRKAEPEFLAARRTAAAGRTVGLRRLGNREPNRRQDRRDHRLCRDSGIHRYARAELFLGENLNPSLINFNISNS